MYWIGIDIGGTFTDVCVMDEVGALTSTKVPTNSDDLVATVRHAISAAATTVGLPLSQFLRQVSLILSGSTVAINAILQRRGVPTGLVTTSGFGDIMTIQKGQKQLGLSAEQMQDFKNLFKPEPLVPRSLVAEVTERVDRYGEVACPLDEGQARQAIGTLLERGAQSLAVCLLWSIANPAHEQRLKALAQEMYPNVFISISSEVSPILGEFERASTTVINSYIGPTTEKYIDGMTQALRRDGYPRDHLLLQASGGVSFPAVLKARPFLLINSGPVGGVLGSQYLAGLLGLDHVVTTDVGGTSFDVGLIAGGQPVLEMTPVIGRYVVQHPMVKVRSIGAGGGSIAWRDALGLLKVGPVSAGARPGPACYDQGGTEPTVTDANVVLGYLNPDFFAGGAIKLNRERAHPALGKLARELGQDVIEVASGIYEIINSQCADLVREVVLGEGFDPADFVLFAYGGAGPTHAASYARELGVKELIICRTHAVHSAFGCLSSDLLRVYEMSDPRLLPLSPQTVRANLSRLQQQAHAEFDSLGVPFQDRYFIQFISMRYGRQPRELFVEVSPEPGEEVVASLGQRFARLYEATYGQGTAWVDAPIEAMLYRLDMRARLHRPALLPQPVGERDPTLALKGRRSAFFRHQLNGFVTTPIYAGPQLRAGMVLEGPAIVEEPFTTGVILPGQRATVDQFLNIHVAIKG